jgi:hypothetical protein
LQELEKEKREKENWEGTSDLYITSRRDALKIASFCC